MSLTINECVDAINRRLQEEGLEPNMNARLIRHYQGGSVPEPRREGKFAKYDDAHVEAIVALRKAQHLGVSAKAYSTICSTASPTLHPLQASVVASASNIPTMESLRAREDSLYTVEQRNALRALAALQPAPSFPGLLTGSASSAVVSTTTVEWELPHNARLSLPQSQVSSLTPQRHQTLDDWIANYPLA